VVEIAVICGADNPPVIFVVSKLYDVQFLNFTNLITFLTISCPCSPPHKKNSQSKDWVSYKNNTTIKNPLQSAGAHIRRQQK